MIANHITSQHGRLCDSRGGSLLSRTFQRFYAENRLVLCGPPDRAQVAITFDDGPDPNYTPRLLAILQRYAIRATFFFTGEGVTARPDLCARTHEGGHVIGNHTYTHPNLVDLSPSEIRSQLERTSNEIQRLTGVRPNLFRPPYGSINLPVLWEAARAAYTIVLWSSEAHDWANPGADLIARRILSAAWNGAIVLLHDSGGDREQTLAALPTIIEGLRSRGLGFVTVPQMLDRLRQSCGGRLATPAAADVLSTSTAMDEPEAFAAVE